MNDFRVLSKLLIDTEWEKYEGDTSWLWHIENPFD